MSIKNIDSLFWLFKSPSYLILRNIIIYYLNIVESVIFIARPSPIPFFSFFGVFVGLMCLLDVWFSTRELLVCVLNL